MHIDVYGRHRQRYSAPLWSLCVHVNIWGYVYVYIYTYICVEGISKDILHRSFHVVAYVHMCIYTYIYAYMCMCLCM